MKQIPLHNIDVPRGFFIRNRFLILRRMVQVGVLALFLVGPLFSVWILRGNLSSSLLLDTVPMTDIFSFLQMLLAGHWPELSALLGVLVVVGFYVFAGGRAYCAWVCPVNPVTDLAAWLREKLAIKQHMRISRHFRVWVLLAVLIATLISGSIVYEYVNPISHAYRLVIFASFGSVWFVVAVFLFDLLISRRGWCGHVCPAGVVYAQLGKLSPLKVAAIDRQQCDDCMDCYKVCPEPQVIKPALKGEAGGISPVISDSACTLCGRCIDVCDKHVFSFSSRFAQMAEKSL